MRDTTPDTPLVTDVTRGEVWARRPSKTEVQRNTHDVETKACTWHGRLNCLLFPKGNSISTNTQCQRSPGSYPTMLSLSFSSWIRSCVTHLIWKVTFSKETRPRCWRPPPPLITKLTRVGVWASRKIRVLSCAGNCRRQWVIMTTCSILI
jgi:hypothetical protein